VVILDQAREMDPRHLTWRGEWICQKDFFFWTINNLNHHLRFPLGGSVIALLGSASSCFVEREDWIAKGVLAAREKLPFTW
jgi:hypothetical protein